MAGLPSTYLCIAGSERTFEDVPKTVSGLTFHLKKPAEIGNKMQKKLSVHIYNQDPTMAPVGKSAMTIMFETDYDYWKNLAKDRQNYLRKKDEISKTIVEMLEERFPGISTPD